MKTLQIKFVVIGFLMGMLSCSNPLSDKQTSADGDPLISLDSLIYKNYVYAVTNDGTFQYFLVLNVRDLNTGIIREICTKGNFLDGALHFEKKMGYDSVCKKDIEAFQIENKQRYFEFGDSVALRNIGLQEYSIEDLNKFEEMNNIDSLALEINKRGSWRHAIYDDKTMLLYAHSLFNRGILTGENNCFGGTLVHIPELRIQEQYSQMREMDSIFEAMYPNK